MTDFRNFKEKMEKYLTGVLYHSGSEIIINNTSNILSNTNY